MPKLFTSYDDPAWPVAMTFIIVNLMAFMYILVVYIIIVTKVRGTPEGAKGGSPRDTISEFSVLALRYTLSW